MPFDYEEYSKKCSTMSETELQKEWENYTRQIAGGATSTTLSVGFAHLTLGASLVGLGLSAPRIHNARKKRTIIEERLKVLETRSVTRKRDVLGPVALSSTIGTITLGLAPLGAHEVGTMGIDHAIDCITNNPHMVEGITHVALDGVGATAEEGLDKRTRKREEKKMEQAQSVMLNHFARWKKERDGMEDVVEAENKTEKVDEKEEEMFCPPALVRAYTLKEDPPAYEDVARPPLPPRRVEEKSLSERPSGAPAKGDVIADEERSEEQCEQPLTAEDLRVMFECKVWKEVQDSGVGIGFKEPQKDAAVPIQANTR